MNLYFKKINLKCEEEIRTYALNELSSFINSDWEGSQVRIKHTLPESLLNIVNKELSSYNIPNVLYCQSYIRKKNNFQGIHVDGSEGKTIGCAINIPLVGCTGSKFVWFSGDYQKVENRIGDLVFYDLKWNSTPVKETTLELDSAYLLRVDRPHSAKASPFEDRAIFTMRFEGNPSFEDLVKNL